jgi:uncharacterized membrane protein required for colicin V production
MSEGRKNVLRAALLAAVVVFIMVGGLRGEIGTVFRKAALICLECIGIG